jgi:hypothetical protein
MCNSFASGVLLKNLVKIAAVFVPPVLVGDMTVTFKSLPASPAYLPMKSPSASCVVFDATKSALFFISCAVPVESVEFFC